MKVYIVTDECSSGFRIRIEAVFLDKEKAYNYCKCKCGVSGDVVEYDTYDDNYEIIPFKTYEYYRVTLSSKGYLVSCEKKVFKQYPNMWDFEESFHLNFNQEFVCDTTADSEEEAIKIARDKRTKYLEEYFGIKII